MDKIQYALQGSPVIDKQDSKEDKDMLVQDRLRRRLLKAAMKTRDRPIVHTSVYVEDCTTELGKSINDNLTFLSAIVTDGSKKSKWQASIPLQIDNGAAPNIISGELARELQLIASTNSRPMEINPVGGNGSPLRTSGKVKVKVRVKGERELIQSYQKQAYLRWEWSSKS